MDLNAYLSRGGSERTTEFAGALGVNPDQVRQWRYAHAGRVPSPENCVAIELASGGLVTVDELRDDKRWIRTTDPAWPHPLGRPCLDVAAPAAPMARALPKAGRPPEDAP